VVFCGASGTGFATWWPNRSAIASRTVGLRPSSAHVGHHAAEHAVVVLAVGAGAVEAVDRFLEARDVTQGSTCAGDRPGAG
jgi:hypothetical protein